MNQHGGQTMAWHPIVATAVKMAAAPAVDLTTPSLLPLQDDPKLLRSSGSGCFSWGGNCSRRGGRC